MAPSSLLGLNVVRTAQHDSQDLAAPFPDFSAHLDLWTNLAFESDEPLASSSKSKRKLADDDDTDDTPPLGVPNQDSHENAVLPPTAPSNSPLDINTLLTSFGVDPVGIPPTPPAPVQPNTAPQIHPQAVPSLAQLLALHAAYTGGYPLPPPSSSSPAVPAPATSNSPPPKRTRTQKLSLPPDSSNSVPQSPEELVDPNPTGPVTAAEDKRRRNTAASARFRLKKKEREVALERRAKELEDRVVELERECEGLRRENGWLKGLVVGVTGAGAAQHQQVPAK